MLEINLGGIFERIQGKFQKNGGALGKFLEEYPKRPWLIFDNMS